ncbi:unnamed protein product [Phaeothamnion confervicola]
MESPPDSESLAVLHSRLLSEASVLKKNRAGDGGNPFSWWTSTLRRRVAIWYAKLAVVNAVLEERAAKMSGSTTDNSNSESDFDDDNNGGGSGGACPVCEVDAGGDQDGEGGLLACSGERCLANYHTGCLPRLPGLPAISEGDWLCPKCTAAGDAGPPSEAEGSTAASFSAGAGEGDDGIGGGGGGGGDSGGGGTSDSGTSGGTIGGGDAGGSGVAENDGGLPYDLTPAGQTRQRRRCLSQSTEELSVTAGRLQLLLRNLGDDCPLRYGGGADGDNGSDGGSGGCTGGGGCEGGDDGDAAAAYLALPVRHRVALLLALCEAAVDENHALKGGMDDMDSEDLRVRPLGVDSNKAAYFWFEPLATDLRVYRQPTNGGGAHSGGGGEALGWDGEPSWEVVVDSLEGLEALSKALEASGYAADKRLHAAMRPIVTNAREEHERRQRALLREEKKTALASVLRRKSSRRSKRTAKGGPDDSSGAEADGADDGREERARAVLQPPTQPPPPSPPSQAD